MFLIYAIIFPKYYISLPKNGTSNSKQIVTGKIIPEIG
jgi:hypothetical protein